MDRSPSLQPLSSLPAEPNQRRLALATALLALAVLAVLVPFAQTPLPRVDAFIPAYQSALVLTHLTTAALLLGQWHLSRSRALAILACGYLFLATITIGHTLSFPGAFAPQGLLGAGPHSTAWMYMFWHGVFPLFVLAYAYAPARPLGARAVWLGAAAAVTLAIALITLATAGQSWLPAIMRGHGYATPYGPTVFLVWASSAVALLALWRRTQRSVLDVWLMVVMCAWICDIALSAVFNAGRFDLGFYAGRIFGLLAASFVLWTLLVESLVLYRRMALVAAAEAQAQETNRAKDTFLAMLGHELRNPLNAVAVAAQVLRMTEDPEKTGKAREVIARQVALLGKIADDLLDVGRALFGKIALNPEAIDFGDLVQQQVQLACTGLLARHRVNSRVQSIWVYGDRTRLSQLVTNLLANAAKFTPAEGEIDVTLQLEGGEAVLCVRDSGVGMAPELIDRVFDPFVQGSVSSDRQAGGLGIGLTLVKRLAELHSGRILASSAGPGQGSAFSLRLPAIEPPRAHAVAGDVRTGVATSLTVVLVEDNDDARMTLRELLQLRGHTVHEAVDGEQGLQLIMHLQPEVAIVDIGLPKMDGWSLAAAVRQRGNRHTRLIALSGYGLRDPGSAQDVFDAYLMKPVDVRRLHALLELSAPVAR